MHVHIQLKSPPSKAGRPVSGTLNRLPILTQPTLITNADDSHNERSYPKLVPLAADIAIPFPRACSRPLTVCGRPSERGALKDGSHCRSVTGARWLPSTVDSCAGFKMSFTSKLGVLLVVAATAADAAPAIADSTSSDGAKLVTLASLACKLACGQLCTRAACSAWSTQFYMQGGARLCAGYLMEVNRASDNSGLSNSLLQRNTWLAARVGMSRSMEWTSSGRAWPLKQQEAGASLLLVC